MIRSFVAACCTAALLAASATSASASHMHQSPALRKNQKRFCPNGSPMQNVRTGRSVITTCL